jgi:mannose-1-phosphate guanylyltransferase
MAKGMILAAGRGRAPAYKCAQAHGAHSRQAADGVLIEHLARHDVRQIMVNVAFNHYKIEDFFGDGRRWGVEMGYSYEGKRDHGDIVPKPLGSAGGCAASRILVVL